MAANPTMSFDEIFAKLHDDGMDASPATEPARPDPRSRAMARPRASAPLSSDFSAQAEALALEIRHDLRKQTGLIEIIATKIRGDSNQRAQVETIRRRVSMINISEENRIAAFLAYASLMLIHQAATDAMHAMHAQNLKFAPDSPAHDLGCQLTEANQDYMLALAHELGERSITRVLKPVGLDR